MGAADGVAGHHPDLVRAAAGVPAAGGAWKLGLALLFDGLGYQLWLNVTLKRRMEEQKTQ